MTATKRVVCLANSRKLGDRCIAGKELPPVGRGLWVRPVSSRPNQSVAWRERRYADGTEPRVLDILELPVGSPVPKGHQQENWLLDTSRTWKKIGRLTWNELSRLEDQVGPLFGRSLPSDRLPLGAVEALRESLRLIRVPQVTLSVGPHFGKRRLRGHFRFFGTDFDLGVTDPVFEQYYLTLPDGEYPLWGAYLTISLGEPWEGACYKLIAAIMLRSGGVL